MANDLVDFDLIEGQKENIQSLPGGRSAKKLAQLYSPTPLHKLSTPTPTDTKNVNDCIRAEYEDEVQNMNESDDPLDVYDRYVRWTLDAYPSAQATPQSQLHTLLERATKAFISSPQYKNDPRYLKLWLHYIQLFSDSPRETYIFLSRHSIGEGLALFYEEFAAWLESAGRWSQAEEVYKLGIEREARPVQRLLRKFKEFEERLAQTPTEERDAPASPALPSIRPALAAKMDPFIAALSTDPQAPVRSNGIGSTSSKSSKPKLAIFSDADAKPPVLSSHGEDSKGWDTIGSLEDRKKENTVAPTPWVGEKLKAGGSQKADGPRMMVFRDPSLARVQTAVVVTPTNQVTVHPQTGKKEYIFVDLAAIYPYPDEIGTERSFEEIIALNQGWLDCSWEEDTVEEARVQELKVSALEFKPMSPVPKRVSKLTIHRDENVYDENGMAKSSMQNPRPTKKKKTMEVNETQIIKAKLDSPSGPKMRKKNASEPTMTMHTRAATDDIYDIFNAPLRTTTEEPEMSDNDDEYESETDYTTDAESTGATTRQDEDIEQAEDDDADDDIKNTGGEWSDFSIHRHIPEFDNNDNSISLPELNDDTKLSSQTNSGPITSLMGEDEDAEREEFDTQDPGMGSPNEAFEMSRTTFVPIPPEDYAPPTRPYRDPVEVANNRLPFMTPITERTEPSLDLDMDGGRHWNYKTPCKRDASSFVTDYESDLEPLSSPLRDIIEETTTNGPIIPVVLQPKGVLQDRSIKKPTSTSNFQHKQQGPVIKDIICNPLDTNLRATILESLHPALSSYEGFYDHRNENFEKGGDIRKFIKAVQSNRKASLPAPVSIEFADLHNTSYEVKRMLGEGAFAPVYLVANSDAASNKKFEQNEQVTRYASMAPNTRRNLEALKMEAPPTPWEFYIMRLAHSRLGPLNRIVQSLSYANEMHWYQDEAFLFLPYHPHGTLLDVVNHFHTESSGVMDEQLVMFFAIELLRIVEGLHSQKMIHGDLKADNCLLRLDSLSDDDTLSSKWQADGGGGWASKGVTMIDFGRGIDMKCFVPEVEFFADWKTSEQDCAEMREARPWTWQIDYYGLAGIFHCLLFGKYIETIRIDQGGIGKTGRKYRLRENLKRYWQVDIWSECFELLLNPAGHCEDEDGGVMPVVNGLRHLREKMENWLETNCERGIGLRSLLGKLEIYAKNRK